MLSKLILDKLIPLPGEDELLAQITAELAEKDFPITNLKDGGVFYSLLRVFIRIETELISLCREMLGNLFVSSADKVGWLEVRAADFSKYRKPALKTEGMLTLTRTNTDRVLKIGKGCIFKTEPGASGDELRFFSTEDAAAQKGETDIFVPVTAEAAGSAYNVPAGKITRCLVHLDGSPAITNTEDWITREGSDIEGIEGLRKRTLGSFADLATNPTRDKYRSACEAVPGALYIRVNDQHPRGQGTIDIVVTGATGEASEALLGAVREAAAKIAGPYDNLLVKASETVPQDIGLTIRLAASASDDGIAARAEDAVRGMFKISRDRALNELYLSDIIVMVKQEIPTAKSIRVTEPAADAVLASDKVIVPGRVTITIERA